MAQNFSTAEYGTGAASATGLTTSTTQKHSGTQSYVVSSGATDQFASYTLAGTGSPAIRAYVYVTSFTANLYRNHLLWITNASSNGLIGFKINASQQITLVAGNSNASLTTLATGTQTFPLNTWVRLEIRTSGTTSYTAAWYANDAVTATETFTGTSSVTINGGTYYTIGSPYQMGGYAAAGYWDDLASNSTGELMGPATAILTNNWESMTNGQTLDTPPTGNNGNTPIAGYNGSFGGVAANTYAHSGTLSLRQPIGTTNSWTIANVQTGVASARAYFYFGSTVTNTDLYFMQLLQGANTHLTIALSIAGSYQQDGFVLLGGAAQNILLASTTQGFASNYLNQWLRFEMSYVQSSGAWQFAIYQNDSTTAIFSTTGTSTNNMPAAAPDRVAIGKLQNNGASGTVTSYWTDDVAFTTASSNLIGPPTVPTTQVIGTQASTWNVASRVTTTGSSTWNIYTPVSTSQNSTWNLTGGVVSTQPSTWNTGARIASTQSSTWNDLILTGQRVDSSWNVGSQVTSTQPSTWGVAGGVTNSQPSTWAVNTSAISSQPSSYNVAQQITSTATSTYTVNGGVVSVQPATWNIATSVTSLAQSTWSTKYLVSNGQPSTFNVLTVVPQARESFWNVAQAVVSTQPSTYDLRKNVASTQASTYTVNSTVTSSLDSTWDSEVGAFSSIDSTWTVNTSLVSSVSTTWDTRYEIANPQDSIYTVKQQVISTQASTFNLVGRITSSQPSTWDTYEYGVIKVVTEQPVTWNTLNRIVMSAPTTWDVLTTLSMNQTFQWSTRYAVAPSLQPSTWQTAGYLGSSIDSTWAVYRRVTRYKRTRWHVLGPQDIIPAIGTIGKSDAIINIPSNDPVMKASKQSVKVTVPQTIRIGEL